MIMDDWEIEAHELLEPLRRIETDDDGDSRVIDRTLEQTQVSIGASDAVELATVVFVAEFLGPILDIFAYSLGLEDRLEEDRRAESETHKRQPRRPQD